MLIRQLNSRWASSVPNPKEQSYPHDETSLSRWSPRTIHCDQRFPSRTQRRPWLCQPHWTVPYSNLQPARGFIAKAGYNLCRHPYGPRLWSGYPTYRDHVGSPRFSQIRESTISGSVQSSGVAIHRDEQHRATQRVDSVCLRTSWALLALQNGGKVAMFLCKDQNADPNLLGIRALCLLQLQRDWYNRILTPHGRPSRTTNWKRNPTLKICERFILREETQRFGCEDHSAGWRTCEEAFLGNVSGCSDVEPYQGVQFHCWCKYGESMRRDYGKLKI